MKAPLFQETGALKIHIRKISRRYLNFIAITLGNSLWRGLIKNFKKADKLFLMRRSPNQIKSKESFQRF